VRVSENVRAGALGAAGNANARLFEAAASAPTGRAGSAAPAAGGGRQNVPEGLKRPERGGRNEVATEPENAVPDVDAAAARAGAICPAGAGCQTALRASHVSAAEGARAGPTDAQGAIADVDRARELAEMTRQGLLREADGAGFAHIDLDRERVFQLLTGAFGPSPR
jgi:hypothetical protein